MRADDLDPRRWLGDTPVLNLRDDKLRLRVHTVTQFARTDTERLRCICNYVASVPFRVPPFSTMTRTRQTLGQRTPVGWYSKAALFEAMLRVAGVPARIRMLRVGPDMHRGLANSQQWFVLPVVELFTRGRWVVTDSYVYDPPYFAAAREAVQHRGWRSGFGAHMDGLSEWDGVNDALVMVAARRREDGGFPELLPEVYDDPMGFADATRSQSRLRWWGISLRNRLMSIRISRAVDALRREGGG